jgi:hypothetical protein
MKPTVAYVAVMDGVSAEAVAAVLKSCNLSEDNALAGEGVTFFMQKADATDVPDGDNIAMFAIEDGIMMGVEMPEGSALRVPVQKGDLSYGEALGKFGVYPMMNVAIDVLRTALSRCTDRYCEPDGQKEPAEVQTLAAAIIADFGNYVAEIISLMPVAALKFDKEIGGTPAMDLYETFLKSEYDPKPAAEPTAEEKAAAEAAAAASAAPAADKVEKSDTNSGAAPAADAGATAQQNTGQEQAAQPAASTDATALMKGFSEEMAKLIAPMNQSLAGLAEKVTALTGDIDGMKTRVEKAETALNGKVIGGTPSGDRPIRKSEESADTSFTFDTGFGRPI